MKRVILTCILSVVLTMSCLAQNLQELQSSYNLKRGIELLSGETPDETGALESFQKEVAEHPKNGYAFYYMGLIYDHQGQTGNALECFTKAVNFLKKDRAWITYAYRLRASEYLKLDKDGLALADWKASLKENPNDELTLSERAEYYFGKKQYDLADADYDKIISLKPGSSLGYKGKGRDAIARKDFQKALDLLNYAVSLAPTDSYSYTHRAEAYMGLKKFNEASDDIIKALDIDVNRYAFTLMSRFKSPECGILLAKLRIQQAKDKTNSLWSYLQAAVYEDNDNYVKAIDAYNAANDIEVNDVNLERIAICYNELGKYDDAISYIDRAMMMDSTRTEYLLMKGDWQYEGGDGDAAIATISSYIDKEPDDYMGYYRRAFIKDCMGYIDGAIEDYTTSLVLEPDFNYALVERGICYKLKGNDAAAIADWQRDIEIDTVYDDCCAHYAYEGLGQYDKAKEVMDSIFAYSQDEGTYYDAACLYSRMGEYDKAMEYLRTSLEKGYRRFNHITHDRDLNGIRNRADFKALIDEYKSKTNYSAGNKQIDISAIKAAMDAGANMSEHVSEIPFTRESGGLCKVRCNINGLPLNFWLDTGSSDVSLSIVEATFMLKNGYLTKDDVIGSSYFLDANGNVNEGTILNFRTVKFGDSELKNVKASVVSNLRAPLLLGQSILARLGSVEIDNGKNVIRIKYYK